MFNRGEGGGGASSKPEEKTNKQNQRTSLQRVRTPLRSKRQKTPLTEITEGGYWKTSNFKIKSRVVSLKAL